MVRFSNKSFGILGGSFDPAHKGHLAISKIAIKKLKLNKILWVVTKQNPFKNKTFYSLSQRITKANKITKNIKKNSGSLFRKDFAFIKKYKHNK